MINVILSGCNGQMGRVITEAAESNDNICIICGFDKNTEANPGYPVYASPSEYDGPADVIIDFSHPSAVIPLLDYAIERKLPAVISTTGLSAEHKDKISEASKLIPVFHSANMSLGVNLLVELVKKAAKILEGDFDIEIIEKHHNQKVDAPSGTALMIADAITDVLEDKPEYVYDRHSVRKKRSKEEIGIHAIRGGTIVGEHDVLFAGNDEIIEIKHTAMSKEVFAVGAIRAAKFVSDKKPGMYSMQDMI